MGKRKKSMVTHYEINVWDHFDEGDLVVKEWDCTQERHDEIADTYDEMGRYHIEIVREWEEEEDDE